MDLVKGSSTQHAHTVSNGTNTDQPPAEDDSALMCLVMMAGLHGIAVDPVQLKPEHGQALFGVQTVLLAAKQLGLSAKLVTQNAERLALAPLPAVAIDKEGRFFIAARLDTSNKDAPRMLIQRPGEAPAVWPLADFLASWTGQLIFFTSKASYAGEIARFDFSGIRI